MKYDQKGNNMNAYASSMPSTSSINILPAIADQQTIESLKPHFGSMEESNAPLLSDVQPSAPMFQSQSILSNGDFNTSQTQQMGFPYAQIPNHLLQAPVITMVHTTPAQLAQGKPIAFSNPIDPHVNWSSLVPIQQDTSVVSSKPSTVVTPASNTYSRTDTITTNVSNKENAPSNLWENLKKLKQANAGLPENSPQKES